MADIAHDVSGPATAEPAGITQQVKQPASSDGGKLRVFISYSRDDLDFADQLDAALNACGFECLIDRHGISGGEDWKRRLGNLISEADTGRLRALAEFGKLPNLRLGGGGSKTPQQTAMSAIAPLRSVQINDKNQRMEH